MAVLAAVATVIALQAIISGVFSLTSEQQTSTDVAKGPAPGRRHDATSEFKLVERSVLLA